MVRFISVIPNVSLEIKLEHWDGRGREKRILYRL